MSIDLNKEVANAGAYPANRHNQRERRVLATVKEWATAPNSDVGAEKILKVATVKYSFADSGSALATNLGVTIPSGATILQVIESISTDFDSTSGTTTVKLTLPTDGDLTAAITADGSNAANTSQVVAKTATADRAVTLTASVNDITAGVATWNIYYY